MGAPSFPIIGIGASAGGVEALTALFKRLTPQAEAAFIVVTHLASGRESLLPEILARCTAMPIGTAQDDKPIERGHVYLNPPDMILTVRNRRLSLKAHNGERNLIDIFFTSLAKDVGEQGIAVILSGTGSDGAIGLKTVREDGGLTLAQGSDEMGPAYHGMPDAAIATGFVDNELPIEALADQIAEYVQVLGSGVVTQALALDVTDPVTLQEAKNDIYTLLQSRVGHDFSRYKDKTFLRRVARRMQVRQKPDLPTYITLLKDDTEEVMALFRDLLISVTNFFRDPEYFNRLAELVIPRLFKNKDAKDVVRVWVPGCATGEEVYSIAMLLREWLDNCPSKPRVQIFATDVSENALAVARTGHYPSGLLGSVSPERLARFFVRAGDSYTVAPEIRDLCLFSAHSIIRDPPFSQIDLISCRNLLIYFSADLQNRVIPLFHYALRPGAFLFLGNAENISQHADLFSVLDKKSCIYQRQDTTTPQRPILPLFGRAVDGIRSPLTALKPINGQRRDKVDHMERRVLERYAPAHVLIGRDGEILRFSARTGKYLEAPAGPPNRNFFAMARSGLRLPLRSAFHEAQETGRSAVRENVVVALDAGEQTLDIIVEPLPDNDGEAVWMVVFIDAAPIRNGDQMTSGERDHLADRTNAFLQLEQELRQTRERLHSVVEEYETSTEELKASNEELVSLNEEMQSMNEELETSKEELQSINEEVISVNSELGIKVKELDHANSDLRNLLDITQLATIFVESNLIVQSFTPAMTAIYKLVPSDRGRSLTDIVSLIDYDGLAKDVGTVVETSTPMERNVRERDGRAHYLVRIVPYNTAYNAAKGAILTFLDVSNLVHAEQHQRVLVSELNHRVKNILAVVASMAQQMTGRCRTIEDFTESFISRIHGLAKTHDILSAKEWSDVDLAELLDAELDVFVLDPMRTSLRGPAIALSPRLTTMFGIIIHELATNAMKYGAFANTVGRLEVEWGVETLDGARCLVLTWRETGGPPVEPPKRIGLGSEMIKRGLEYELDGRADVEYRPDGLIATLTIPIIGQDIHEAKEARP